MEASDAQLLRIFNECQQTPAVHRRCIKELVKLRREGSSRFSESFKRCVIPLFQSMKKEPVLERLIKFVTSFVTYMEENRQECDTFVDDFLRFLLSAVDASDRCVRYRSCQLLSEIVLALPAEVSAKVWDEVAAAMQRRSQDKVAGIRIFSIRALALFYTPDVENDFLLHQFRRCLSSDPSPEVRKAALQSIPITDLTVTDIVERTADVSGAVRKVAFAVIGAKIPINSLSIRHRTVVLQRGLLDRESSVSQECRSMLKEEWLAKDCEMDVQALLKYLDVETNEKVGDLVMQELLKEDALELDPSKSLRSYLTVNTETETGTEKMQISLMEAEEALYWKALCSHLYSEAQEKSSEAAKTRGAHASVLQAEAGGKAQLLEAILPSTVDDFVALVDAHQTAGPLHSFASRQLLILAIVLDFSDAASRKSAASMINRILCHWTSASANGSDVIGDGIHLGGEKKWSDAVVRLAKKVHASPGAFVEALTQALLHTGRPCREGGATILEWLQCLAITGILLENLTSIRQFPVSSIQTHELVEGLLLPAVNHPDFDVERAAVKCLAIYSQLEEQPSQRVIWQLETSLRSSCGAVAIMATRGLFDLILCHGAAVVEAKRSEANASVPEPHLPVHRKPADLLQVLLDLLLSSGETLEEDEGETLTSVAAEGFAKLLMQSKVYPELDALQSRIVSALLRLYFDEDSKDLARLRQCLSVFFHNYPSVAPEHKRCISKAFVPLIRELWPGLTGNPCNALVATSRKKIATQLSRFMLELLQRPLFSNKISKEPEDGSVVDDGAEDLPDEGNEHLAVQIAAEILSMTRMKQSPAVKSYKSTLCKTLVSLKFRASKREDIKLMRRLLDSVIDAMPGEKLLLKELKAMALEVKKLDQNPDEALDMEQLEPLLAAMGIDSLNKAPEEPPKTPAAPRTKQKPVRRAVVSDSEDDDDDFRSPPKTAPTAARLQRTCKSVAVKRMESISKMKPMDFQSDESSSNGSDTTE